MTIFFPSWWSWRQVSDFISGRRLFHRIAPYGIDWHPKTKQWEVTFEV